MTSSGPRLVPAGDHSLDEVRERIVVLFREHYSGLCGFVTRYVKSRDVAMVRALKRLRTSLEGLSVTALAVQTALRLLQ